MIVRQSYITRALKFISDLESFRKGIGDGRWFNQFGLTGFTTISIFLVVSFQFIKGVHKADITLVITKPTQRDTFTDQLDTPGKY